MTIRTRMFITMAALLGVLGLVAGGAVASNSSNKHATDACPTSVGPNYTCEYQPATKTTSTNTKVKIKKTVREQVKQYENVRHVRVTIDQKPGGVESLAGCVDPIAKGWIKPYGFFSNTGGITVWRFGDRWKPGWGICQPHRIRWNGMYWMEGTKSNCKNVKVRIPLGPYHPARYIRVVEFTSVRSFQSTYHKWARTTTKTHYSCDTGWTLTFTGSQWLCYLATPVTAPPPPPTTTTTTTTTTTPKPSYSCSVSPIVGKGASWNVVSLNIATNGSSAGPTVSEDWDGGGSQTAYGLNPSYTYSSAGTYHIKVTIQFNDGSTTSCSTSATVKTDSPPPKG